MAIFTGEVSNYFSNNLNLGLSIHSISRNFRHSRRNVPWFHSTNSNAEDYITDNIRMFGRNPAIINKIVATQNVIFCMDASHGKTPQDAKTPKSSFLASYRPSTQASKNSKGRWLFGFFPGQRWVSVWRVGFALVRSRKAVFAYYNI